MLDWTQPWTGKLSTKGQDFVPYKSIEYTDREDIGNWRRARKGQDAFQTFAAYLWTTV
jgi:hypothetical protein